MMHTSIYCHDCRSARHVWTAEDDYPPMIHICDCGRWFRLIGTTDEDAPIFHLAGVVKTKP